eukprot:15479319-Alexandrium_andersonii.AAC.1
MPSLSRGISKHLMPPELDCGAREAMCTARCFRAWTCSLGAQSYTDSRPGMSLEALRRKRP